jgi:AraC-like DNA-binding protein
MEPFAKYPLLRTSNVDEAESVLSDSLAPARILHIDDKRRFRIRMNGVRLGRISIVFNKYETGARISSELSEDSIYLIIGSGERSNFKFNSEPSLTIPGKGIIIAKERQIAIDRLSNSEILVLRVSEVDLHNHFERLINSHNKRHLAFDRIVNLGANSGAVLKRLINHLVFELNNDDMLLKDPNLAKAYDDMMLTAIVSLPHNLRQKLHADRRRQIAPSVVHRAEEYMAANLSEPITIADLLRICNCSRSALFWAFRKTRGYTPMEFIAEKRLQCVRQKLLQPYSIHSVSDIAQGYGFRNLGRFSQMYKKRFGESPSKTLQKGRRI